MEKGEPTLVPEWLRNSGSVSGSGNSAQHFTSSSPHSDVSAVSHNTRSRNSRSNSEFDSPRSALLDRSSSSNSRRSSNNGSARHAYSSFSRSHRDKDRERDKERMTSLDYWDNDDSDGLGGILMSRGERDTLRRSQSMVSRKQVEGLPRRISTDLRNGSSRNHANGNGLVSGANVSGNSTTAVFEKDFPSLGSEERQGTLDIGRVSSPGFSSAVQSLPVASSALLGGEGWTSALAEVPTTIGSSSPASSSIVQTATASISGVPNITTGLNMAEALVQAPSRTRTPPQVSVQTQRLEELAIRQSRQLIPMTPSMPKSSVLTSEKSKPKTLVRATEMNVAAKSSQQQQPSSLHPANQSKSDASKTSHGKLFILKPGWENGVTSSPKDVASPTISTSTAASSQATTSVLSPSTPLRNPINPKLSSGGKPANLNVIPGFTLEKKPSLSQTQSRNDFFNLLKMKTSTNTSTGPPDSSSVNSSNGGDKSGEVNKEETSAPPPQDIKRDAVLNSNGVACEELPRFSDEETAFLRSLGWEENSEEDEGLTEEEINSFYQEYMKLRPSLKISQGIPQKAVESNTASLGGASAELSSSDSE